MITYTERLKILIHYHLTYANILAGDKNYEDRIKNFAYNYEINCADKFARDLIDIENSDVGSKKWKSCNLLKRFTDKIFSWN